MVLATVYVQVNITYTETTLTDVTGKVTRAGGTATRNWPYWVVAGTTAQQTASATTCVNTHFSAMKVASSGKTVTINSVAVSTTRTYAPFIP